MAEPTSFDGDDAGASFDGRDSIDDVVQRSIREVVEAADLQQQGEEVQEAHDVWQFVDAGALRMTSV